VVRKILPYTTVALVLAFLYVGWTLYSRHESNRRAQEEAAAKQAEARKNVVDQYFGSGEVRFPLFHADSAVLKPGEKAHLCYGVVNAVSVKLDPPVEPIKPTYRHCIEIAPQKTTTYTITGVNAKGRSKSVSLEVRVER
jgi:hypothetical protein